jgi:hypothetical protein
MFGFALQVVAMPTIVVGTAERMAKHSPAWVLTLLHEHFHQWKTEYTRHPFALTALISR